MAASRQFLTTGIPSLDALMGGGIRPRQSILVTGEPGCGKTVLCSQVAFTLAARGTSVVFATITSESHDKLVDSLSGFSFCDKARIGEELFFLSAYAWLKEGSKEARELLLGAVRERRAKLLVIDGLRSIRDLWQDEAKLREFLYELVVGLATADCLGVFTTEYPLPRLLQLPEATTVDGILSLSVQDVGNSQVRRAQVAKLRGQPHLSGKHVMRINGEGISLFPRMETQVGPRVSLKPSSTRATFGIPELDKLLGGGLPGESATLIAGSSGIGKTMLALHFAISGAANGEPVLYFSLAETPDALSSRARRLGLDLETWVKRGQLRLEYHAPLEVEADELVLHLFETLHRMKARRLVVDAIDELERTLTERDRLSQFLTALTVRLRTEGVSSVFIKKISKVTGPELDFSNTPISTVTENLLLLRFVELRGQMHRLLSILNVRDSAFDRELREFEITEEGFRVMDAYHSVAGLLTGQAYPLGDNPSPQGEA
jgi:circadian clock protein KaiC